MSITNEWAHAHSTLVSLALRGDNIEGAPEPVSADYALILDPQTGGGLVIEGTTTELLRMLDYARHTVSTYDTTSADTARATLRDWDTFTTDHAALTTRALNGEISHEIADQIEDEALGRAGALAAALRTLLG